MMKTITSKSERSRSQKAKLSPGRTTGDGRNQPERKTSLQTRKEAALLKRLVREQPQSIALLERLRIRFDRTNECGPCAPVEIDRCSACHMTLALAEIERLKKGGFVNCPYCSRFLYCDAG
jgi:predicted  nucleic acid-binding Zn-ribbon protein